MRGRIFWGLCILFIISFLSFVPFVSGFVDLEDDVFDLGVQVDFYVSFNGTRLEIVHDDRVFRMVGDVLGSHSFFPESSGDYVINVINGSDIVGSASFSVIGEDGFAEESFDASPDDVVFTGRENYRIGEEVEIDLSEDLNVNKLVIKFGEREFSFSGTPTFPVSFFPSEPGEYYVLVEDDSGETFEGVFFVEDVESSMAPFGVVNSRGNFRDVKIDVSEDASRGVGVLSSGDVSDFNIQPRGLGVREIKMRGFDNSPNARFGLEEIRNVRLNDKNSKILSLGFDFEFDEIVLVNVAEGSELLMCDSWVFESQECEGSWSKVKDLVPGEEYELVLSKSDDNAYAETGVASINSKKSIYQSGDVAELVVVVLDRDGYLTPGADVIINITDPRGEFFEYGPSDIVDAGTGIYYLNHTTSVEGRYDLGVSAIGRNVDDSMVSFFVVRDEYEFDIIRDTPVTIDPYQGPFKSSVNVSPRVNISDYSFTEVLPSSFSVEDYGSAVKTRDADNIYLTWSNLNGDFSASYSFNSPFIIPYLWAFQSFIDYEKESEVKLFEEARPWYLAIDPITYYDPTSDITTEWSSGSGTSYTQISKGTRQPSAPSTATSIASGMGDEEESEFGFSSVVETGVEEITLWVYSNTGNTAEFTYSLRQGGTTVCSNLVPGGSSTSWSSCTWSDPSGSLDDLSVHFGHVERASGGGPTDAVVYAAYLEVDTGTPPPEVSLSAPGDNEIVSNTPVDFSFSASDETYSTLTCDLYTNITGSWDISATLSDVDTDTLTSFSLSPSDGVYEWNVRCENEDERFAFADDNRTVFINAQPPLIENEALNETIIRQNRSVRFSVSITDSFGVDIASITAMYPDSSVVEHELERDGDEFFFVFTDTLDEGIYNITNIWANDTLGQSSEKSVDLWFEVEVVPPTEFDLLNPLNATESRELNPTMSWEETVTPDFDNYTLIIADNPSLSSPDFVYSSSSISQSEYSLDFALDANRIYYWKVIAYDVFGNSVESSSVFKYITDRTAPVVSLEAPVDNFLTSDSLVSFSYIPSEENTLSHCELHTNESGVLEVVDVDSSPIEGVVNSFERELFENTFEWEVHCFDEAGNDGISDAWSFIIDQSGPDISLFSPDDGALIDDTNVVTFSAGACCDVSGIDYCELLVNGSVRETKSDIVDEVPFNFSTFLSNNYYEWNVRCFDSLGNFEVSDSRFLTVESLDTDPPVISLLNPESDEFLNSSSILFEYLVEDATGIESCSLFVDDELDAQSFSVDNFEVNTFSLSDFSEGLYNWSVSCVDNSSENNIGFSSVEFFTVDLTDPVVDLNIPEDGAFLNFDDVNFVYTPFDENLDECFLYSNVSGSFEETASDSSPVSGSQNVFSVSVPSGSFSWNVLCVDKSSRVSFASENFSLSVDTEAPKYSDIVVSPQPPVSYAERVYYFNISWEDNFGVDTVLLQHNFSGEFVEEELFLVNGVYSFSVEDLDAGLYGYSWFANDSSGNFNETSSFSYFVNKSLPVFSLSLNGVEDDLVIDENEVVSIAGDVAIPDEGYLELYLNNDLISSGNGFVEEDLLFEDPGSYNVSLVFNETDNYFYDNITYSVNVLDVSPPVVLLESPGNNSLISTGTRSLNYNVNDSSPIESCSLYVNGELNQVDEDVARFTSQFFSLSVVEDDYSWRVECTDVFDNTGVSETRFFTGVDDDTINIEVSTEASWEVGTPASILVNSTDAFLSPLNTFFDAFIISGETGVPWWDSDWGRRRNIVMNETSGVELVDGVASVNITGLEGSVESCDELRFVNHESLDPVESLFTVHGETLDSCFVSFAVNLDANIVNYDSYYVYYDNPNAGSPSVELDLVESALFNANDRDIDDEEGGSFSDLDSILGKDDDSFAVIEASGGGDRYVLLHGRDFIDETFGDIERVEARFRYEVPESGGASNRIFHYSVDDGASYTELNRFSGTIGKTTSQWFDITESYSSLSWSELNRTRLQGEVVKSGGAATITMYLYWVELNVTYIKDSDVDEVLVSGEEVLVDSFSGETSGSCGCDSFSWNTQGVDLGLYSSVVLASAESYDDATSFTTFEVAPDVTPPNVSLINPEDGFEAGRGLFDFSYRPYDFNLDNCTLFLGSNGGNLEEVVTDVNVVNNETNTFEDVLVDIGIHEWNVECVDSYDNIGFADENFLLNISAPDLVVRDDDIWFDYDELIEGVEVSVFANVSNEGLSDAEESFNVSFYLGNPVEGGEFISSSLVPGLGSLDVVSVGADFDLSFGSNNVFVVVDPEDVVNETTVDNNVANNSLYVELYQYYFGSSSSDIVLGKDDLSMFIEYRNLSSRGGLVFFSDVDASFSYGDLQALTRNVDGGLVSGDFSALDDVMGTAGLSDSIRNTWGAGSEVPVETRTFNLPSGPVNNVPVVASTEYDDFVTGILWDTSDDSGNERFDSADKETVVFVTEINPSSEGRFGIYDFEVRVPATLRTYSGSNEKLAFYIEII